MDIRWKKQWEDIKHEFRHPPAQIHQWTQFALIMTGLRLVMIGAAAAISPLALLAELVTPLCYWAGIPLTLVNLEHDTWRYFKNVALLGAASAAAGVFCVLLPPAMEPEPLETYLLQVATVIGYGVGTALFAALFTVLDKYLQNRKSK